MLVRTTVVAVGLFATQALANVTSGSFTRTENWVTSPGGDPCQQAWGASWNINTTTNVLTISQTVRLNAAAGSAAPSAAEMNNWESRIESTWNNAAYTALCINTNSGATKTFTLRYDIMFTTTLNTFDASINVFDGAGSTSSANWYRDGGSGVNVNNINVAAHEVGHLLGNPDEYTNGGCIVAGSAVNGPAFTTTSLMNNTNSSIAGFQVGRTQPRHYGAWELAFNAYDTGKNLGNIYAIIPAPGVVVMLPAGVLVAMRRRR